MKILVAIPNYNNAHYICETIDSVLSQEVAEASIDIVVFDNKSTDNSVELIRTTYGERVTVIVNPANVGAVKNHKLCIDYAKKHNFDMLKMLSSDDVLMPDILSIQSAVLMLNTDIPLATCNMIITDDELNPGDLYKFYADENIVRLSGNNVIKKVVNKGTNLIGGPSNFLIRVSELGDVNFDCSYRWVSDLKFACQLIQNKNYVNCNIPGFFYRRHSGTDSSQLTKEPFIQLLEMNRLCIEFGGGIYSRIHILGRFIITMLRRW